MIVDDLFENNIIPFPDRKIKQEEPRHPINHAKIEKLIELNKKSIARQSDLALPTIMAGEPKGIKPVVAWANVLKKVSDIKDRNKIQQWIFDKGREIIDTLITLNKQDLDNYKILDQMPMKFWQVGTTSALVYKHKQIDKGAEDALHEFKKKYVDNVDENKKIVTVATASKNGKINHKLADKITDPHGYFNHEGSTNEGEIIQFPKKNQTRPPVDPQHIFDRQRQIENEISNRLKELHQTSLKRQRYLALPTIMHEFDRKTKPVHAWALIVEGIVWKNPKDRTDTEKWIYEKAQELCDRVIAEIKKDLEEYEDLYTIADSAPSPRFARQDIGYSSQPDRDALQVFQDLKTSS